LHRLPLVLVVEEVAPRTVWAATRHPIFAAPLRLVVRVRAHLSHLLGAVSELTEVTKHTFPLLLEITTQLSFEPGVDCSATFTGVVRDPFKLSLLTRADRI